MSISVDYIRIGKSYTYDGNTYQVYGQTSVSLPWYWATVPSASSFDCDGFGYNNQYVWVRVCRFVNDWDSSTTAAYWVVLQAQVNGERETRQTIFNWSYSLSPWQHRQLAAMHALVAWEIDDTATSYRIRIVVWDWDGMYTRYSNFTISNCPASWWQINIHSLSVWKSLKNWSSVVQTFWWKEVWSIDFSAVPFGDTTSGETTISCSWLQNWHYIWVSNFVLDVPSWISSDTITIRYEVQWYIDWEREILYTDILWNYEVEWGYYWNWWEVLWIEDDCISTKTNSYRVRWFWVSNWWYGAGDHKKWFTISNLNVDSTRHEPWCLWIDWWYIYYTDVWWSVHHIDTDWASDWYVWTENKWSLWMVDSWLTNMRKLYYVTETWYIWHTHTWRLKNWWESLSPWINYKWSLWVEDYCLCFVNANWEKVYMGNWDVT